MPESDAHQGSSARLAEIRKKTGYIEAHGRFDGSMREPRLALSLDDLRFLLGRAGRLDREECR